MRFTHEYDAHGNHRLILNPLVPGHEVITGEWANYQGFAYASDTYYTPPRRYFATTDFWTGDLKADTAYELLEAPEGFLQTTQSQVVEVPQHANDW